MIKVHHLDCCPMFPVLGRMVQDEGRLVAHCLLVETDDSGLVLVDSGLGLADVADRSRLGRAYSRVFRPKLDPAITAIRQIEGLGFRADDVRHILLTHLDVDHAGGLSDFPAARVHVCADEHAAAMARATSNERQRYRPTQWAHGPDWALYRLGDGEGWFGFDAVRALPGLPDDILAIPLLGHTRGHSGIAVRDGDRWLLAAGDAYFHRTEMTTRPGDTPRLLRMFERNVARDWRALNANQGRLRELVADHGAQVRVFSAHDPVEFDQF